MKYKCESLTRIRCVWNICWDLNTINLQLDESIGNIHVNLTWSKGNEYKQMLLLHPTQLTISSPGITNTAGCSYHSGMNHLQPFGRKIERAQESVPGGVLTIHLSLALLISECLLVATVQAGRHQAMGILAAEQYNCYYVHINWRYFTFQRKIGFPTVVLLQPEQSVYCSIFFRVVFALMKKYEAQAHQSPSIQLYETIRNDTVTMNVFITKDRAYKTSILLFFHKTGAGNTSFSLFLSHYHTVRHTIFRNKSLLVMKPYRSKPIYALWRILPTMISVCIIP